jgi:hypothetical protein
MRHLRYAIIGAAMAFGQQPPIQPVMMRPETVMVTLQAKSGNEAALAQVIEKHWNTARRLNLILESLRVTVRGEEAGKVYFVHIFTWRDASLPDRAPSAIQAIWTEMNALVEARNGRPGLEFVEVVPVEPRVTP